MNSSKDDGHGHSTCRGRKVSSCEVTGTAEANDVAAFRVDSTRRSAALLTSASTHMRTPTAKMISITPRYFAPRDWHAADDLDRDQLQGRSCRRRRAHLPT